MDDVMIALEDVSLHYANGRAPARPAVHKLSLAVRKGELVALLGGSGCGKTTTLKMINRLLEPTAGTIRVAGQDVRGVNPVALRRTIGYVIQGSGLFPHMTVAQNIAVVPRLLGWKDEQIAPRVSELLALVKLGDEVRHRLPRHLSGGQQQRVGFARALAARPPVMLMDEPFGALDPKVRDELREDFQKIRRQLGLTAVLVTHDMTEALRLADKIAVMNEGRLVCFATPRELVDHPDPYVHGLLWGPLEQTRREVEKLRGAALVGGVA